FVESPGGFPLRRGPKKAVAVGSKRPVRKSSPVARNADVSLHREDDAERGQMAVGRDGQPQTDTLFLDFVEGNKRVPPHVSQGRQRQITQVREGQTRHPLTDQKQALIDERRSQGPHKLRRLELCKAVRPKLELANY